MKRLIFFSMLILAMPLILTNFKITDFGVMQSRREYAQVFKTGKGNVYVFDKRVTLENEHEFRLPATHEHFDERLYAMLVLMEGGNNAADLYKGIAKGALTTMGVANLGGGSDLTTSTAGSMLGNRFKPNADVATKSFYRFKEWMLAGYLNALPAKTKQQLILTEACQSGAITGCTLVASQLWRRMATSDSERLLLAASVRYPLSQQNQDKIAKYMQVWCESPRLKDFQFGHCDFDTMVRKIVENQEGGVRLSNQINRVIFVEDKVLQPLDIITVFETVQGIKNADVEIRIQRVGDNNNHNVVFQATNNAKILGQGFSNKTNIASIAKLLIFIKNKPLPQKSIDCLAQSNNECVYSLFNQTYSEFELMQAVKELGLDVKHRDSSLIHAASFGNVAMSSVDVHMLLGQLAKLRDMSPNRYAMKAAMNPNGTLAYANSAFRNANVIIAKSGTHANRQTQPVGVVGSLAVFAIQSGNEVYTISIRLHARKGVICVERNCTSNAMRQLTKLSGHILNAMTTRDHR